MGGAAAMASKEVHSLDSQEAAPVIHPVYAVAPDVAFLRDEHAGLRGTV